MNSRNAWMLAAALALAGAGCGASAPAQETEPVSGDERRVEQARPQLPPAEPGVEEAEPQAAAPQSPPDAPSNVLVRITSSGFEPASATINVGDTVTWVNDTNAPTWIASKPHPVHTDYPEFDSKSDLRNGESWTFKFMKAGTWGYHDHFKPFVTGTVTVE